jgi:hypothetical protein
MKFKVYDEDGFLSIVNTARYKTFVDEDWTLEQLFEHFASEMNSQNMVIWQAESNGGGEWTIEVLEQPSGKAEFRSFSKTMEVTNNELYLVNYTDLTMAAQFDDIALPAKENADWRIPLQNGAYQITVRQMFDPADYNNEHTDITAFEVVINASDNRAESKVREIFWLDK